MKKISVYIFLILFGFFSASFAEEDEFDIEGFKLGMSLLDWEKAFDKVRHNKLLEALKRLNVPPRLFQINRSDVRTSPIPSPNRRAAITILETKHRHPPRLSVKHVFI